MLIEQKYNLDTKKNSPVIILPWFNNCRILIDTGATLPMWLKSIVPLKIKGAVKENRTVNLKDVGGNSAGDLYRVNFDFGNIHFMSLPIVHKEISVADAYMILPATLFEGMIYEIDNINHIFTVKVDNKKCYRDFQIKDEKGIPYIYLANAYETKEESEANYIM